MSHIRSVYEWHKEHLWLQFVIISICGILINFFELHPVFQSAIYAVSLAKIVLSLKLMNVNPGSVNDLENFSWKYYQSLPVNKNDLYRLYLINHLFNYIPGLFWFLCFHRHLAFLMEISPWTLLNWLPIAILTFIAFGLQSFVALVVYPRTQFSRVNKRFLLFKILRNGLYFCTGAIYLSIGVGTLAKWVHVDYPEFWGVLSTVISYFWNKYFGFALIAIGVTYQYHQNFSVWLDEKRKTPRSNWKALRDIPLMTAAVAFLIYPITYLTSTDDGGPDFHEAVIENKIQTVKRLIKDGADINQKNNLGFTPIMTAAYRGRGEIYSLLVDAGARQDFKLGSKKDYFYNGADLYFLSLRGGELSIVKSLFRPENLKLNLGNFGHNSLHIAAIRCHEAVLEFLIENKADVNVVTNNGRSPLHFAAKGGCFPAVASLLEAGADTLLKDKYNKFAYEYGSQTSRSPASYIKRKTLKRLPQK